MAFLPPEQQNQYTPQGQTTPNPMQQGTGTSPPQVGGSAGAGSTGPKAPGPSAGTSTQFGSSASKLGDYLTANAPQIGQQAQNVTNQLNNQYGQVQGDITNAVNQFGQTVQGGYTAPNQDLVNQATSNPTQFVSNPNNVSAFQSQYNDTYTGPQNFESTTPYAGIQNEVSQAVQNAGLLNSQAGLQNYLRGTQGGNQTQASNTLDALLLQGNPQAQQQLQQASGQFKGLTDQFGNAVTGANQSVPAAQQAAQQAAQYAQSQLGQAGTGFNNNLQNLLNTSAGQVQAYNNAIPTYNSNQNALNQIGQQWNNWNAFNSNFGVNPYKIDIPATQNLQAINAPTLNQIATPEQLAEQNALNQLSGSNTYNLLNANQPVGGYKAPGSIPDSNATAQTLWNEINQANDKTIQQNINPLAVKNFDQMNILLNALKGEYGSEQQALQAIDPTLGQALPR